MQGREKDAQFCRREALSRLQMGRRTTLRGFLSIDMTLANYQRARRLLGALHHRIHAAVMAARERQAGRLSRVVGVTQADTIYHVDRIAETVILAWFEREWPRAWPVELVMEGLDEGADATTFPRGTPISKTVLKCIVDPIDGTRGFMYDQRSAWVLTGLAPQRGNRTSLADIVVAVMTELPVVKQAAFDQLSAVRGQGAVVVRYPGLNHPGKRIRLRPSEARNFDHGFVSFSRFFPEGKTLLAEIEERFWRELKVWGREGGAKVFEDQYVSTGGQVYELIAGHDRLIADLRPLIPDIGASGIRMTCCHPYDICTALILEELGGVVEDPRGSPLRAPLDTTTPVAWVGYANRTLARLARPALRKALNQRQGKRLL